MLEPVVALMVLLRAAVPHLQVEEAGLAVVYFWVQEEELWVHQSAAAGVSGLQRGRLGAVPGASRDLCVPNPGDPAAATVLHSSRRAGPGSFPYEQSLPGAS